MSDGIRRPEFIYRTYGNNLQKPERKNLMSKNNNRDSDRNANPFPQSPKTDEQGFEKDFDADPESVLEDRVGDAFITLVPHGDLSDFGNDLSEISSYSSSYSSSYPIGGGNKCLPPAEGGGGCGVCPCN